MSIAPACPARLWISRSRVQPGDTALFYFAGHGVALEGGNYLPPTDIPNVTEAQRNQLRTDGFLADDISDRLRERGAATTVMVLDACRNNPFKAGPGRSIGQSRGLSRMDTRRGLFVMFSAGAGQEALDRLGPDDRNPNSVFTRLFIDLVKRSDLDLIDVAKELQVEVPKLAQSVGHEQLPAYYDQIPGRVFLARADGAAPPPARPPAQPVAAAPAVPARQPACSHITATCRSDDAIANRRRAAASNLSRAAERLAGHSQHAQRPRHQFPAGRIDPRQARPASSSDNAALPQDGRSSSPWCQVQWRSHSGWASSCCIVNTQTGAFPR